MLGQGFSVVCQPLAGLPLQGKFFSGSQDEWHTYGLLWSPTDLKFYADGALYHTVKIAAWFSGGVDKRINPHAPFDKPFYLVLNMAVGGNYPAVDNPPPLAPSRFPYTMEVDYVRVWRKISRSNVTLQLASSSPSTLPPTKGRCGGKQPTSSNSGWRSLFCFW